VSAGHRHSAPHEHEHEFEPVRGLPEALPPGEEILWQGNPDWRVLARRAFHLRKLTVYFVALLVLRLVVLVGEGATALQMVVAGLWMALLGVTAVGLLASMAWLSARTAVYTITNRRVVMRIGIVLTLAFNIPFKRIAGAGLSLDSHGHGDIPLMLSGDDRIAWLNLWPHARPWRLARPEPMLRCVPQAADVAAILTQAWSRSTGIAAGSAAASVTDEQHQPGHAGQHALAGR
jgi:Bacterial PH domain